jgi:hypothetical protein
MSHAPWRLSPPQQRRRKSFVRRHRGLPALLRGYPFKLRRGVGERKRFAQAGARFHNGASTSVLGEGAAGTPPLPPAIRPPRRFGAPFMVRERSGVGQGVSRLRFGAQNAPPRPVRRRCTQYMESPPWSAANSLSPGDFAPALLYQHRLWLRWVGAGVEAPGRRLSTMLVK